MTRNLMLKLLLAALLLSGATLTQAIPGQMSIGGRLLDSSGNPVIYYGGVAPNKYQIEVSLTARIDFYDSLTATTPFNSLAASAKAFNGYFSIMFTPPEAVLLKDKVWYALAIDADRNGLSASDLFPDKNEIGAVPFALSAKPQHNYTTFGGRKDNGILSYLPAQTLFLAPFETPPGGVEFNQMNIFVSMAAPNVAFSFGIYDDNGTRVANSGLIKTPVSAGLHDSFLQVKVPATKLQPATVYYVGVARKGDLELPNGLIPVAPVFGTITMTTSDGQVPASFNPASINPNADAHVLPVALIQTTTVAKGADWTLDKASGTAYRWIPSQGKKGDTAHFDSLGRVIK